MPPGFEIALMVKLDHPNVLRLFETFEDGGFCFGSGFPALRRVREFDI